MSEVIDGDHANAHVSGTLGLQLHAVALNEPTVQVQFKDILLKRYPSATESVSGSESDEIRKTPTMGTRYRNFGWNPRRKHPSSLRPTDIREKKLSSNGTDHTATPPTAVFLCSIRSIGRV